MGLRTDYPNINYIFGFFYPGWKLHYDWKDKKPEYQPIIRFSKTVETGEKIQSAVNELKELIKRGEKLDDEQWYDYFMSDSSLGYYPPGGNQTYKEWLQDVLRILEEPIQETEKHFIPKFLG